MSRTGAVRLFVGGHAWRIQGEPQNLVGDRCFSAAHRAPRLAGVDPAQIVGLLDSGAFSEPPTRRLTLESALARQLAWEQHAGRMWGGAWQAAALASYDVLIDETWTGAVRTKRRWSVADAERAVDETVAAAGYLAGQRAALAPRTLVLGVQGVDAEQYARCARQVLAHATPADWVGLGGWCILGRWRSWLPVYWAALRATLPLVADAGVRHVHMYGVLWEPALAGLLWLADRTGLTVSTDSSAPMLACTYTRNPAAMKKSGQRRPYWRDNVRWWVEHLAGLRSSPWYREPPVEGAARQLALAL